MSVPLPGCVATRSSFPEGLKSFPFCVQRYLWQRKRNSHGDANEPRTPTRAFVHFPIFLTQSPGIILPLSMPEQAEKKAAVNQISWARKISCSIYNEENRKTKRHCYFLFRPTQGKFLETKIAFLWNGIRFDLISCKCDKGNQFQVILVHEELGICFSYITYWLHGWLWPGTT